MAPVWEIPLDRPPRVLAMGRNAHGFVPRDRYRLPDLWSLHLYGYDALLRLDGQEVALRPGTIGVAPPGTLMEYRYFGISVHLFAHFELSPGPTRPVAAIRDLGAAYEPLFAGLYEVAGRLASEPRWAAARVWDALWTAASLSGESPDRRELHPAVRRASGSIDRRLGERIAVADLAQEVGVHPTYLARLFGEAYGEAYGETVVGHIRRRRMEKASHLLRRSTLPIKAVAASVGYPDLQRFNKVARQTFGVGPREWRAKG